jgi:tetratricopeptide (TPR) repeat protein
MAQYAPPNPRRSSLPLIVPLIVLVVCVGAYFGAFDNPVMRDGRDLTSLNPQVGGNIGRDTASIWFDSTPAQAEFPNAYRPMLVTLLRLQWGMWSESPSSFHGFNLMLFLAVAYVYLLLVCRLTGHPGARVTAALVLALHPMASQSVLSIPGQGALLSLLACLTACLLLARWRQGRAGLTATAILIAVAQAVAVGAYEMGALLPVWLVLTGLGVRKVDSPIVDQTSARQRRKRRDGPEPEPVRQPASPYAGWLTIGTPLLVVLGGAAWLRVTALGAILPLDAVQNVWSELTGTRAANAPAVMLLGWKRLFWPLAPTLIYAPAQEPGLLPAAAFGWAALAFAVVAIAVCLKVWRPMAIGLAWAGAPLAAVSHWIALPVFFSEAPLLFALPGLGVMAGALVEKAAGGEPVFPMIGWRSRVAATAIVLVAAAMAAGAWQRTRQWSSEANLWRHEAAMHPAVARPETLLADALFRADERAAATEALGRARALATGGEIDQVAVMEARVHALADQRTELRRLLEAELDAEREHRPGHLTELARMADKSGWQELREDLLRKELKLHPRLYEANFTLGKIEYTRHNDAEALRLITQAAAIAPFEYRAVAYLQLAEVLAGMGYADEAIAQAIEAIRFENNLYPAYILLTRLYWGKKEYARAEETISLAFLKTRPRSYIDLASLYVRILEDQGRKEEARTWLSTRSRVFLTDTPFQLMAAETLVKYGEFARAEEIYKFLRPAAAQQQAEIYNGLGRVAFFRDDDRKKAVDLWRRALLVDPTNELAPKLLGAVGASLQPEPGDEEQPGGKSAQSGGQ